MIYLVSIDPGLRGCGIAVFDKAKARLLRAAYVTNPNTKERGYKSHALMARELANWLASEMKTLPAALSQVIIELPRIYPGPQQQKGDLNDLLDVTGVGSAFAALCNPSAVQHVIPSEWKGQVPKKVMNERVLKALDNVEVGNVRHAGSKDHNTLDGVGIGLNFFGRINRKVYA
jgi:hypothetical protein